MANDIISLSDVRLEFDKAYDKSLVRDGFKPRYRYCWDSGEWYRWFRSSPHNPTGIMREDF